MKRLNPLLLILVLLCSLLIVNAAQFTPQGNMNLRGVYSLFNATNISFNDYICIDDDSTNVCIDSWDDINTTVFSTSLNVTGEMNATGDIHSSGNIYASGQFVGTINASYIDNFDIAGTSNLYYANIINMSDESVTYVDGSSLFLLNSGDTATGNYTFDTNLVHIDANGDAVGIGTTTPSSPLNIISVDDQLIDVVSNDAIASIVIQDVADAFNLVTDSNIGSIGGSSTVATTNLNVDLTNGNVGIGTIAPSEAFHVNGISRFDNDLDIYNVASVNDFTLTNNNNDQIIQLGTITNNAGSIRLLNGSSSIDAVFDAGTNSYIGVNGGNFGIGTASPANTLDVSGGIDSTTLNTGQGDYELYAMNQDVETTDAVTFATVDTGQGANELYDMDQNVLTTSAVTFATVDTGQGANELYDMDQNVLTTSAVTFNGITDNGALDVIGTSQFYGEAYFFNATYLTDTVANVVNESLIIYDLSSNPDIVLNASADSWFNGAGDVGIGTIDPDGDLHISDTTAVSIKFEEQGTASWRVGIPSGATYFAFDNANDDLSSPDVSIASDGDVGLGVTAPDGDLEIYESTDNFASLYFDSEETTANTALSNIYGQWSDTNVALISVRTGDDTINKDNGQIAFFTSAATGTLQNRMQIDEAGNVGIGTDTPGAPLDLHSTSANGVSFTRSGTAIGTVTASNNDFELLASTEDLVLGGASGKTIVFKDGSTENVIIDANGNVGIGTTSPTSKLDVVGNASFSSTLAVGSDVLLVDQANSRVGINTDSFTASPSAELEIKASDGFPNLYVTGTSPAFDFLTTGGGISYLAYSGGQFDADLSIYSRNTSTDTLFLTGDNLVGVGTTTPTGKLHIVNTGTTTGLFIDQDANTGSGNQDGAIAVDNTGNLDYGVNVYSNAGATANRQMIIVNADNAAFDQHPLYIRNDGTKSGILVAQNSNNEGIITGTQNGNTCYLRVDADATCDTGTAIATDNSIAMCLVCS